MIASVKRRLWLFLLLPALAVSVAACRPETEGRRLLLQNLTLVDGTGRAPTASTTLIVRGRLIEAIRPAGAVEPGPGDSVVDASGLWAIPGLWDAHVHLSKTGNSTLPLLVGMGITTVRDMGGDLEELREMQRSIEAGALIGPRIFMAGPMLESSATLQRMQNGASGASREPRHLTRIAIPDTGRAREVVDSLARLGVDFVKIREYENESTYRAVVQAARDRGLTVAGHAPFSMDPVEGAALGVSSYEHASYPYPLDTVPEARQRVLDAFLENSVTIVPTLIAWETNVMEPDSLAALFADSLGARDRRRPLISDGLLYEWRVDLEDIGPRASGYYAGYWGFLNRMSNDLAVMYEAGVPLVAGSDLAGFGLFPGFALHEELERLVEWVGLTPMEAIVSATRAPAELLAASDSLGTIEPGKVADLVLLSADPIADIRNTRRLSAVVLGGRYLGVERIDELRRGVPSTATGTIGLVRRPNGD